MNVVNISEATESIKLVFESGPTNSSTIDVLRFLTCNSSTQQKIATDVVMIASVLDDR